ncbi:hypothetical protein [Nocardia brasiliensis]|nr:hypothetical protein [Nocardia brasiliensis]
MTIDSDWLKQQLDRFGPDDMDEVVLLIRGYGRADREQARREAAVVRGAA